MTNKEFNRSTLVESALIAPGETIMADVIVPTYSKYLPEYEITRVQYKTCEGLYSTKINLFGAARANILALLPLISVPCDHRKVRLNLLCVKIALAYMYCCK